MFQDFSTWPMKFLKLHLEKENMIEEKYSLQLVRD